jgi:hypothetical protein
MDTFSLLALLSWMAVEAVVYILLCIVPMLLLGGMVGLCGYMAVVSYRDFAAMSDEEKTRKEDETRARYAALRELTCRKLRGW